MQVLEAFDDGSAELRAALDIQRVGRGSCGRAEARALRGSMKRMVARIQCAWRGYWQRAHGGGWRDIKARLTAAARMVQRRFRKTILLRCAAAAPSRVSGNTYSRAGRAPSRTGRSSSSAGDGGRALCECKRGCEALWRGASWRVGGVRRGSSAPSVRGRYTALARALVVDALRRCLLAGKRAVFVAYVRRRRRMAGRIQRVYRGWRGRVRVRILRADRSWRRHAAAKVIQLNYRVHRCVRKRARGSALTRRDVHACVYAV